MDRFESSGYKGTVLKQFANLERWLKKSALPLVRKKSALPLVRQKSL